MIMAMVVVLRRHCREQPGDDCRAAMRNEYMVDGAGGIVERFTKCATSIAADPADTRSQWRRDACEMFIAGVRWAIATQAQDFGNNPEPGTERECVVGACADKLPILTKSQPRLLASRAAMFRLDTIRRLRWLAVARQLGSNVHVVPGHRIRRSGLPCGIIGLFRAASTWCCRTRRLNPMRRVFGGGTGLSAALLALN